MLYIGDPVNPIRLDAAADSNFCTGTRHVTPTARDLFSYTGLCGGRSAAPATSRMGRTSSPSRTEAEIPEYYKIRVTNFNETLRHTTTLIRFRT